MIFRFSSVVVSILIIFQVFGAGDACRLIVPPELLNGCIFDPMIVSVSHSGYSVKRENCNAIVSKDVFAEQPLVYYGRARSVCRRRGELRRKSNILGRWRRREGIPREIAFQSDSYCRIDCIFPPVALDDCAARP